MILDIQDATITFPDGDRTLRALDGVSMNADAGELVAIVGESGSGKSTLLSVAAGLIAPDSGEVSVAGRRLDPGDENERARVRREEIGVVFQQPNLLGSLTAREQLLIADHLRGIKPRRGRADELLARVGLEGLGSRRTHELSGGQRQRVNIARALMGEPKLLLADEPTSALDHELSRRVVELLRGLTDELGVATVMVTHDRSQLDVVDRAVTVADGRAREVVPAAG